MMVVVTIMDGNGAHNNGNYNGAHNNDNDDCSHNNDNDMAVTIMTIVMAVTYHDDYYLRRGGSCSRRPARPGRAVDAAFWRPANCGKFLM